MSVQAGGWGATFDVNTVLCYTSIAGVVIHIIVNQWGCHGNGVVVQISVQTIGRRAETPTLHHRAAACADRWIRFAPGVPWHDGVVYEVVSPMYPSGTTDV